MTPPPDLAAVRAYAYDMPICECNRYCCGRNERGVRG